MPARTTLMLAVVAMSLVACGSSPPRSVVSPPPPLPKSTEVVPYSRYTLIELGATEAPSDLMSQVVDITFPPRLTTLTVLDALRVVLEGSGYGLCQAVGESHEFSRLLLPNVHRTLGPIRLRQALTTLIGGGWHLSVDEQTREVCVSAQS